MAGFEEGLGSVGSAFGTFFLQQGFTEVGP